MQFAHVQRYYLLQVLVVRHIAKSSVHNLQHKWCIPIKHINNFSADSKVLNDEALQAILSKLCYKHYLDELYPALSSVRDSDNTLSYTPDEWRGLSIGCQLCFPVHFIFILNHVFVLRSHLTPPEIS